jgi:serine/threonine-protein kinase
MGAIWRAQHLTLEAPVAVKLIDRDAVHDEQTVARFLREAKAAATLRSPHVVQIIDYGVDEGVPFIVMELLEGETLAQRLKRVGPLNATDTARFVTHIARAVGRAHEAGIVHRDLKPENVFIVHNEDEEIAKVLDFGVAKVEHGALALEGERTRTGSILGTPYYMSPEQAQGNKAVDHRSDLWSLGVIAFECLTGRRPFFSDGLGDLVLQICVRDLPVPSEVATVPLGFDAWFARAIDRDPALRFQSSREMSDALREALGIEIREPGATAPEVSVATRPEPLLPAADLDEAWDEARPGSSLSKSAVSERAELATLAADADKLAAAGALGAASVVEAAGAGLGAGSSSGSRVSAYSAASVPRQGLHSVAARDSRDADPIGATVAYSPERVQSELEAAPPPAFDPGSSSGSGLGVVVAVAAVALALGLGGGLYALQRYNLQPAQLSAPPSRSESILSEPSAEPPQLQRPESIEPKAAPSAPSASAVAPSASAALAGSAPPRALPEGSAAKDRRDVQPAFDAGVRSAVTPDAGWVKPAWAIPDPEPKRVDDLEELKER